MVDFHSVGIKVPTGSSGNIKTICPACTPHDRKPANRNSKDLSVNIDEGIWNCHNCGWSGTLKQKQQKEYTKPVTVELPLSDKTIAYFDKRGIKPNTLKQFGITEKVEYMPQVQSEVKCILFPFVKNGEWVNVKYRDARKNFKLTSGAELTIFNYDGVNGKKKIVITEGEIDCLSVYQSGFFDVCSVPNGASKGNQNLQYIDNSWQAFSEADEIIIATDNDEAGVSLKNELVRRLGRDRCKYVVYPDGCKDFNDVLVKHGASAVFDAINNSVSLPVEGVHRLSDFLTELEDIYNHGFQKGVNIGYLEFDNQLNFSTGQLTVITGVPNSGKSAFLDQILIRLASRNGWLIGVCSFENQPIPKHISNLSSLYCGKPFYRAHAGDKMSPTEFAHTTSFLHDKFFWFKMKDEDLTVDGILNRAKQLVKTHGIKALVIDPYNYMEHKRERNQSETEYVSELLTKICSFAKDYDTHVFLVAHPVKMGKDPNTKEYEVPTLYNISGSAHFFNKCDNGIAVHRNRADNTVDVHVQKVRFFMNGSIGYSSFDYDVNTGRYKQQSDKSFYSELHKRDDLSGTYQAPEPYNPQAGIKRNFDEHKNEDGNIF